MKPVVILKRSATTAKNTGVDIYSKNVEAALTERGMPFETAEMVMDTKAGYLNCLMNGIIRPFIRILRQRDRGVHHAIDEMCCLFLPFVKGKKVVTFHHVIKDTDKDMRALFVWHLAARIGLRYSDVVIAISPQTKKELMERYRVRGEKIVTVLNGVSASFVTLDGAQKERSVGCVSTLIARKNVAALLRSFSLFLTMDGVGDVKLRICGKGPEKAALEELAVSLGISGNVEFLSDLSEDELVRFYNSLSVLANPSMHEGFGYVTLEAQRCSAPVVYFKDADIPEEVTKFAVPCDNETDMAEKMYALMTDRGYRDATVAAGREYADSFGPEFSEKITGIYMDLMQ